MAEGRKRVVGRVQAAARLSNCFSRALAPAKSPVIELSELLIDTGAQYLCLPADMIRTLDLRFVEDVDVWTAHGLVRTRLFEGARLEIIGRSTPMTCIELPEGREPKVGWLPLEALGMEPDFENGTLLMKRVYIRV